MSRTAHTPVTMPPMGKIRMWTPGRTNGAPDATTKVWIGGWTVALVTVACLAKTPETKFASVDDSVVLTAPVLSVPVRVMTGVSTFCSAALQICQLGCYKVEACYLRALTGAEEVFVDLTNKGVGLCHCRGRILPLLNGILIPRPRDQ